MKKALFSIISRLTAPFVYFATPVLAFAATPTPVKTCADAPFDKLCKFTEAGFGEVVGTVITIAFVLAVVIALAFLIFGGIKWITSGGDKTAVESARNTIVAAIIGLVIVFLSYFILNIILGVFDISLQKLALPQLTPK